MLACVLENTRTTLFELTIMYLRKIRLSNYLNVKIPIKNAMLANFNIMLLWTSQLAHLVEFIKIRVGF